MIVIIGLLILLIMGCVWLRVNNGNKKKTEIIEKSALVAAFKNVNIDSTTDNVKFRIGDHYRVTYRGIEDFKPSISVKNGTLNIDSPSKNISISGSIFDKKQVQQLLTLFNSKQEEQLITIEMPEKELDNLSIDLSNGSVFADQLSVKTGSVNTSNGNVNIRKLLIKKGFQIDASNGTIRVGRTNAKGYDFSTSNGRIFYKGRKRKNSYTKNEVDINTLLIDTSNGDIEVN